VSGARAVLDHVIASISAPSQAQAFGARQRLGGDPDPGSLAELAVRLAAARHAPAPRTDRKVIVVVLGEHGCADPGVDLGDAHPAVIAARAIDAGEAALASAARTAGARVVLVDAGLATRAALPASVVRLSAGRGAADITREPAMTPVDTLLALQSGIALGTALAVSAVSKNPEKSDPVHVLGAVGGPDLALLAGLVLAAASVDVPVVLEDHGTGAAALAAARMAPEVAGYLIAAHGGTRPAHRRALAALGLAPLFALGLGSGEGSGAALALGLVDGAARLLR
jgi:nicotinate-nucleotide--dimethylbenzimidazole phosphoribosyltransferase